MLDVVLNTITIGIDDLSWSVGCNGGGFGGEDISILRWNVSSVEFIKLLGRSE
jgi:hypothetical protein